MSLGTRHDEVNNDAVGFDPSAARGIEAAILGPGYKKAPEHQHMVGGPGQFRRVDRI
ncbi:MAG: hypothetical protein L0G59_01565 [Kocuria sp.]|nr:hypothetical protein [Kocuria sp.]MDN5655878.1 hypothetical protein [Kocuria sp.]